MTTEQAIVVVGILELLHEDVEEKEIEKARLWKLQGELSGSMS